MERLADFFSIFKSVFCTSALSIPKGKEFIAFLYNLFISNKRSRATELCIIRKNLDKFKTFYPCILRGKAINSFCSSAYNAINTKRKVFLKINIRYSSASYYCNFHNIMYLLQK